MPVYKRASFENKGGDQEMPFKLSAKKSAPFGGKPHLAEFKAGDGSKIVRGVKFYNSENGGSEFSNQELLDMAIVGREEFRKLSDKYNIMVAPTDLVVGHDAMNQGTVFSVTSKVEGQNFDEIAESNLQNNTREEWKRLLKQANDTAIGLFDYFCDKAEFGGHYLADLNFYGQYVYGKTGDDNENNLYLVDTDVLLTEHVKGGDKQDWINKKIIAVWQTFILTVEYKLSDAARRAIRLEKARKYIYDRVREDAPAGLEEVFENLKLEVIQ